MSRTQRLQMRQHREVALRILKNEISKADAAKSLGVKEDEVTQWLNDLLDMAQRGSIAAIAMDGCNEIGDKILRFLRDLAWPIVVLLVIYLYTEEISKIMERFEHIEAELLGQKIQITTKSTDVIDQKAKVSVGAID